MSEYEEMVRNIPQGLDRIILRILGFHKGRIMAIGGDELTRQVNSSGFSGVDQRTVREVIKILRRQENLICSTPGKNGGYYLAEDKAEFDEFIESEFTAKIIDMTETRNAMIRAAKAKFGNAFQARLL